MATYTIPNVVERTPQGERSYDVFSRLLSERIIFLGTEIDDGVANVVIAQLLHLESSNPESEIAIYINSPGGSFTSLMAIYDTMTFVQAPISTFCVGQAASTAAVLLAGGDPGRRFVLEHARVLLGQPASGGRQGTVSDLSLQAKEMMRIRCQVEEVLARHTHHDVATLRADMDRDKVFTAQEAVAYGLADEVLSRRLARPDVRASGRSGRGVVRRPGTCRRGAEAGAERSRPDMPALGGRASSPWASDSRSARPRPRARAAAARTSEEASLRPRSTSERYGMEIRAASATSLSVRSCASRSRRRTSPTRSRHSGSFGAPGSRGARAGGAWRGGDAAGRSDAGREFPGRAAGGRRGITRAWFGAWLLTSSA